MKNGTESPFLLGHEKISGLKPISRTKGRINESTDSVAEAGSLVVAIEL